MFIEIKWMMLMAMLQMANNLSIRQKIWKIEARPAQFGSEGDTDHPARPQAPKLNVEVTIPVKYLSNFWRYLNLPLINFEVELHFT